MDNEMCLCGSKIIEEFYEPGYYYLECEREHRLKASQSLLSATDFWKNKKIKIGTYLDSCKKKGIMPILDQSNIDGVLERTVNPESLPWDNAYFRNRKRLRDKKSSSGD